VDPAEQRIPDYAGNRLDELPLLEDVIIVTDRPQPDIDKRDISLNRTLDDAIVLLQGELDRLQATLETCRRLDHPRRAELVRWHVQRIDRRQDALAQLQAMLVAGRTPNERIH
jgi:hypothetical protein